MKFCEGSDILKWRQNNLCIKFILTFQIYQRIKSNVFVTDRLYIVTEIAGKENGVQAAIYLLGVIEYYLQSLLYKDL